MSPRQAEGDGAPQLGVLLLMPNLELVELAGASGLDVVVLDTTRGPADSLLLLHHVAAARANGIAAWVRIPDVREAAWAVRCGAAAILADGVSSADAANRLVRDVALAAGGRPVRVIVMEPPVAAGSREEIVQRRGIDAVMADLTSQAPAPGRGEAPTLAAEPAAAGVSGRMSLVSSAAAARSRLRSGDSAVVCDGTALLTGLMRSVATARTAEANVDASGRPSAPLVVLPGMLGDAETWATTAILLGEDRDVRSARIDLDDSVPAMAASVLTTAPPEFALAGHSLGGIVALEMWRQAPQRITRLALLNTSARPAAPEQLAAWSNLRDQVEQGDFARVARELAELTLPEERRRDEELVQRGERSAQTVGPDGFLRQLAAQATRPDSGPTLPTVDVPTLVMSGALDMISPVPLQEELARGVPGAQHDILPEVGHMAPLEAPELVADRLQAWWMDG